MTLYPSEFNDLLSNTYSIFLNLERAARRSTALIKDSALCYSNKNSNISISYDQGSFMNDHLWHTLHNVTSNTQSIYRVRAVVWSNIGEGSTSIGSADLCRLLLLLPGLNGLLRLADVDNALFRHFVSRQGSLVLSGRLGCRWFISDLGVIEPR